MHDATSLFLQFLRKISDVTLHVKFYVSYAPILPLQIGGNTFGATLLFYVTLIFYLILLFYVIFQQFPFFMPMLAKTLMPLWIFSTSYAMKIANYILSHL